MFTDDDELSLLQILMDTSDSKEMKDAMKLHITMAQNEKLMYCPQRVIKMNDFARDIVHGIVWDHIREKKVHPKVLFTMGLQHKLGLKVNKARLQELEMEKLDKLLGSS